MLKQLNNIYLAALFCGGKIDSAIRHVWRDGSTSPIDVYYELKVPQGTKVYVGGTQQIVVPGAKDIKGIEILEMRDLK